MGAQQLLRRTSTVHRPSPLIGPASCRQQRARLVTRTQSGSPDGTPNVTPDERSSYPVPGQRDDALDEASWLSRLSKPSMLIIPNDTSDTSSDT
eukprot:4694622-Pyramimonas_sp.AAC.1